MVRPIEALAEEVLSLPRAQRTRLLDRMVTSLDQDRARDEAWDALAARREAELDSVAVQDEPLAVVLDRLRAELE